MTKREEEEQATWPEELADLEKALHRFERGDYGFYGTMREPGLIPRLVAIQTFWETRRDMKDRIGAHVKEWESFEATITMPAAELYALHRHIMNQINNLSIEESDIRDGEFDPLRIKDFVMKKLFLDDMKKVCERAAKRVTEARAAIIQHREPVYDKDEEDEEEEENIK